MNNPCTTAKKLQATLALANIHVHDSTIRKVIIMHARPSLTCFGSNIDKTIMCQEDGLNKQIKVENDEELIDGNGDMGSYDTEGCSGNDKNVGSDYITGDGVLKNERSDCDLIDDAADDRGSDIKRRKVGDEVITDDSISDKNGWSDADNISDNSNSDDNGWRDEDNDLGDKGDCDDQKCDDGGSKCSTSDRIQGNDIDEGIKKSECVEDLDDDDDRCDDDDNENKRSNDDNYFTAKLAVDKNEQSGETYGGDDEIADNFGNDKDEQMSNHSVDDNTRADCAENQKRSNHDAISDDEDQRKTVDNVGNIADDDQKTRHNESHVIKYNNNNNNNAGVEKHHDQDKSCVTKASKDGNGNSSDGYDVGPRSEFEENAFDYSAGSWDEWGWM